MLNFGASKLAAVNVMKSSSRKSSHDAVVPDIVEVRTWRVINISRLGLRAELELWYRAFHTVCV